MIFSSFFFKKKDFKLTTLKTGDVVITKKRVSAFAGSDLGVYLRTNQVTHIVLMGLTTSGVILSTSRDAADMDLKITVISDACADANSDAHIALMRYVLPRECDVMTSDEFIGGGRIKSSNITLLGEK